MGLRMGDLFISMRPSWQCDGGKREERAGRGEENGK